MLILLILGYIAYGFTDAWGYYCYMIMCATGVGIVLLFRNQMRSMRTAKIISVVTNPSDFKVKRNLIFSGGLNFLILLFSGFHFYLYYEAGKSIQPLYTEYGIGGLLGAALWWFEFKKGQIIITEQGVVTGSKIRPSLICWSAVASATQEKGTVTIVPKQTFGVQLIEVRGIRATQQLTTLLRIHNKMK